MSSAIGVVIHMSVRKCKQRQFVGPNRNVL